MARVIDPAMTNEVTIVGANEASWQDLQAVFGTRGDPSRCRCQRYKMRPGESWASAGAEELAFRLRTQTDCGRPEPCPTSGLVAYLDGEPVGWCAVEPRTAYPRLLRSNRVPWAGPHARHVRGRRVRRGRPAHAAPGRDARRLLGARLFTNAKGRAG
jgi:hypothetical protein